MAEPDSAGRPRPAPGSGHRRRPEGRVDDIGGAVSRSRPAGRRPPAGRSRPPPGRRRRPPSSSWSSRAARTSRSDDGSGAGRLQGEQLLDVERVPVGELDHSVDPARPRSAPRMPATCARPRPGRAAPAGYGRASRGAPVGQDRLQRMSSMELIRAIGEDEQDAGPASRRARNETTSRVDRSAQWRSSMTATTSRSTAARTSSSRSRWKRAPRPTGRRRVASRCAPGSGATAEGVAKLGGVARRRRSRHRPRARPAIRGSAGRPGSRRPRRSHAAGTGRPAVGGSSRTDRLQFGQQPALADPRLAGQRGRRGGPLVRAEASARAGGRVRRRVRPGPGWSLASRGQSCRRRAPVSMPRSRLGGGSGDPAADVGDRQPADDRDAGTRGRVIGRRPRS